MSTTPAFSPGPWMTRGPDVGSVRSHFFEDLYEQCSFHIAEKMPSSVKLGSRPIRSRMRWYSSGLRPCEAISSGVMGMSLRSVMVLSEGSGGGAAACSARRPAVYVGGNASACRPFEERPDGGDAAGGAFGLHDEQRAAAEIAARHQQAARAAGDGVDRKSA